MIKSIFAFVLLAASLGIVGCSGSDDGPSFSDDDLLKRANAGREAGMKQQGSPPPSSTGQTTSGN